MTLERISAFITYCIAVLLAWMGDLSLKDVSTVGGVLIGVLMLVNQLVLQTQNLPAAARRKNYTGGI